MKAELTKDLLNTYARQGLSCGDIASLTGWERACVGRAFKREAVQMATSLDRFWKHVKKTDTCWQWTSTTTKFGHGKLKSDGVFIFAHRKSYILHKGSIPEGLLVRHSCDNPGCVNPDHLLLGTKADNSRDMVERGRHRKPVIVLVTHCLRGHEYNPENTTTAPGNTKLRICRACRKIRNDRRPRKPRVRE